MIKASDLVDKFGEAVGNEVNIQIWETRGTPLVMNKRLVLKRGDGVRSIDILDITNDQTLLRDIQPVGTTPHIVMQYKIPSGDLVSIELHNDELWFRLRKNGLMSSTLITFDPDTHTSWRIRERYGVLYWDTSEDSSNWITRRQLTHEMNLTKGKMTFMNTYVLGFGQGSMNEGRLGGVIDLFENGDFGIGDFGVNLFGGDDIASQQGFGAGTYGEDIGYGVV